MICSIHQPNFMPWLPFFKKIEQADLFVILSHCQYEKNGFQNRFYFENKWHTMSTNSGLAPIVNKKYLNYKRDWNKIKVNLKKYEKKLSLFDDCINDSLFLTNTEIIKKICSILDIKTKIVTDFQTNKTATERLIEICKFYKCEKYLSGESGKVYLNNNLFLENNIQVNFQEIKIEDKKSILEII